MHPRKATLALLLSFLLTTPALAATPTFVSSWGALGNGNGQFNLPWGVAVDSQGDVYVADYQNNRVQKFNANGTHIATWGSPGSGNGQFNLPHGVAVDGDDNVYVTEVNNHRVQKFDANGTWLASFGSNGTGNGQFNTPLGIAVDQLGNVFVADGLNHRIQKFSSAGAYLAAWGSFGSANGQFRVPQGVAVDATGNVYVVDQGNHRVQKFDGNGALQMVFGMFGLANGELTFPQGIAVNANGNIFVASLTQHHVQKFAPDGTFMEKVGVQGGGAGQFSYPGGIAVALGDLYFTDSRNHRVQKWNDPTPIPPAATLDIDPGTYPNLVVGNESVVRVALMGGSTFNLAELREETILLEGCSPVRFMIDDVGIGAPSTSGCNTSTLSGDGVDDLVMEFRARDVFRSVPMVGGEVRTLRITGQMKGGAQFAATDCIVFAEAQPNDASGDGPALELPFKRPSHGNAAVEVTLPGPARVGLDVLDVSGRVVDRLMNEERSAGRFTVNWNQRGLASGVYFVRMTAGERVITRTVTIRN